MGVEMKWAGAAVTARPGSPLSKQEMTMSETTATRPPRQRRKPERFCKLSRTGKDVVLVIRVKLSKTREQLDSYTLEPIPADHGRGLLLHKADGTSYAVCLSGPDS